MLAVPVFLKVQKRPLSGPISQIITVFYLDKVMRNKHNIQGEKALSGIMDIPVQFPLYRSLRFD